MDRTASDEVVSPEAGYRDTVERPGLREGSLGSRKGSTLHSSGPKTGVQLG